MQVTTANYFEVITPITLPEQFTRPHNLALQASENNWQAYRENETIRRVTDLYFQKLSEYISKGQKTKKTASITRPKPTKRTKTPKAKPAQGPVLRKAKPFKKKTGTARKVALLRPELVFIRRYVGLHNKAKSKNAVLTFIRALQKAIVQKIIRKTSPHADTIRTIQDKPRTGTSVYACSSVIVDQVIKRSIVTTTLPRHPLELNLYKILP